MPKVRKIKTKQHSSMYRVDVSVEDDPNNLTQEVEVTVHGSIGQPMPEPQTVLLAYDKEVEGIRYFTTESLNFTNNAVGLTYDMTGKLLDANGQNLGTTTQPVTIEEAEVLA